MDMSHILEISHAAVPKEDLGALRGPSGAARGSRGL